jgi:uncharacterized protein
MTGPPAETLGDKIARLYALLGALEGGALVAFSGGADSALLAVEARCVLGKRLLAVIADSPTLPRAELASALAFGTKHGFAVEVVQTREMENPDFVANDAYRCFHCKHELFTRMECLARERGMSNLLFGAIADDAGDWRPGMEAASELGVRAPLLEAGLTKADVRERSRELGLETAEKPASACLSSRFPQGRPISLEDLARVERAEALLRRLGFSQCRVRLQGDAARIEVEPHELERAVRGEIRAEIVDGLKAQGFCFVSLDMEGFRSGSLSARPSEMNHGLGRNH